MARKLRETQAPAAGPELVLEDEMYNAASLNPALMSLYSELGIEGDGECTVHVSKLNADGKGNEASIWRGSPEDYDLEKLARVFGTGQYRVKVYVRNDQGFKPKRADKVFFWQLTPAEERKLKEQAEAPIVTPNQSGGEMRDMFGAMIAAMKEQTAQIIASLQPRETNPLGTLEGIKQIAELMKPANVAPQNDFMTVMTAASKLLEISKGLTPANLLNENGDISTNALLLEGIKTFGEAVKTSKAVNAAPAAVSAIASPLDELTPEQQTEIEENMLLLKIQLKLANNKAAAGGDPVEFAETIWDLLPDEMIAALLDDPQWFGKLCEIDPKCAAYQAWYESVRNQLIVIAREESEAQPEETAVSVNLTAANNGRIINPETPATGTESAAHGSSGAATISKPA